MRDGCVALATRLGLRQADRAEVLPSGRQLRYVNRIGRAKTCLGKAGLVDAPRRAFVRITERGREALSSGTAVPLAYFNRFSGFQSFRSGPAGDGGATAEVDVVAGTDAMTPDERLG